MLTDTPGIHHVTGLAADAQRNLDFYAGVLGLRLVKRTVNQEDMLRYHLFYGNGTGEPGTVFTSFPYPNEPPGRVGRPQISAMAFAVPPESLAYWADRLESRGVDTEEAERFGDAVLRFEDPDGTRVELVATDSPVEPWTGDGVPERHAIRGIHGVSVLPTNPYATGALLDTLGFELVGEEQSDDEARIRYRAGGDRATVVDVLDASTGFGREGTGSIQHVAVRVASVEELYEWHSLLRERDYDVSRVRDRYFFHSLYVRDAGGILFELATEKPGLTRGEDVADLGESLALPDRFEADRDLIESQLEGLERPAPDDD
ncbi:VOC family protein [Halobacterium litoreum]|uniref:VOC family protein n=1 Tax=Halobacterium litoreum TaxID=2039234 RepID=A0ABD5NHJ5_9EURY|nr:VOC family protein [Halobacterium litoreum]UHH12445.1 VOC family protein [Halobacterium litoreum]